MKHLFSISTLVLLVLISSLVSCTKEKENSATFNITVADITSKSMVATVLPSSQNILYYSSIILKDEYIGDEALAATAQAQLQKYATENSLSMAEAVSAKAHKGDDKIIFEGLQSSTSYYVYVSQISANGVLESKIEKVEAITSEIADPYANIEVGDYLLKDGSIVSKKQLFEDDKENCIAIVFQVGHQENDLADYSSTMIGQSQCHGYAIAIKDAKGDDFCCWGGEYGTEYGCYPKNEEGKPMDNWKNVKSDVDWDGYNYTQKIVELAESTTGLDPVKPLGFPAFYYAFLDYEEKVAAPMNTSGWFLPSIGQLRRVYENLGKLDFIAVGGENFTAGHYDSYWSSSEDFDYTIANAARVFFSDGAALVEDKEFGKSYVRSIIAF